MTALPLAGKVALVTASSRTTGAVIAASLARAGAATAIHYHRSQAEAGVLAQELREEGLEASTFGADGWQPEELRRLAGEVSQRHGGADILVNNLGPYADTLFLALPESQWDWILDTTLKALCGEPFASLTGQTLRLDAGWTIPTWEYRVGAVEWQEES